MKCPALPVSTSSQRCQDGGTIRLILEERVINRSKRISTPARRLQLVLALSFVILLVAQFVASPSAAQEVPELQIHSTAYIVIDADTGEIYAQKNAHDHRAMASLTKVFTATEALRRASLDHQITTEDSDVYDDNSTRVGFGAGETFSMQDLLYGMLLPSGNDAAHAIARDLGTARVVVGVQQQDAHGRAPGGVAPV